MGLRQFLATESPFKIMKIVPYFMPKALFILKILSICHDVLAMKENDFIRKLMLFMTPFKDFYTNL